MKEQDDSEGTARPATPAEKRPYQKPQILAREALEAMAVDCTVPPPGLTAKDAVPCTFSFS